MRNVFNLCVISTLLFSASVFATEYPARRAGLWRMTMNSVQIGGDGITVEHCVDAKTDKKMQVASMQGPDADCEKQTMKKTADGLAYQVVCKFEQSTATTNGTISGDYNTHYEIDNVTRFEPAYMGMDEQKMHMTADYKGACPSDLKAGDMRINGMIMNVADVGKPQIQIEGLPDTMKPEDKRKLIEDLQKKIGQ